VTSRKSYERIILFSLWLLIFSASSQIMIISPILPVIGEQLNMPAAWQGWLVSAYAFMVGFFALVAGPISDRIGRRRILLLGTASMTVALALHALAFNWQALMLMRVLAGVAGGILSGAAVSYIGDYFPYERRGWANGWIMSGAASGQVIGIPLGTILAEYFGFRTPFLMFAVTMAATWVLIHKYLPQPPVQRTLHPITIRSAMSGYWSMIRQLKVFAAMMAFFAMFVSVGLYVIYFPTWLRDTFSVSGNEIALMFMIGGIANVITGPRMGRLSDQIGRRGLILFSCVGIALIMFGTTWIIQSFWIAYPLFFLTMVLVAMRVTPFQALLTALEKDERRGMLMSLSASIGQAGFGLGGALAGLTFAGYGYPSNTIVASVFAIAAAVFIWRFVPEPPMQKVASRHTAGTGPGVNPPAPLAAPEPALRRH
jgi:predicted MFS family arabinose efflux permease